MARVLAVDGHVDDRADAVAVVILDAELLHQLAVARGDGVPVDRGGDAVAADLLNIGDAAAVNFLSIRFLQTLADRVRRGAFGQRRIFQQLLFGQRAVMHGCDLEDALRQRAGLVEDDDLRPGESLEIVGTLDQDALLTGPADAREEAQRDADDEGARAADDEEGKGTVDPLRPVRIQTRDHAPDRREDGQRQRRDADGGRINFREARDERLGAGFARAGVLDEIEDLRDRGLAERLRRADLQHAGHVDAAADDLVARADVARHALAGQSAGVEAGAALDDHAVERDLFARLNDDDAPDLDLVRVDLRELTVLLDVGVVRTNVHQGGDVPAGFADGVALEQLADLVEQHDRDALDIVAALRPDGQAERTERCQRHQEVFIKRAAVEDAFSGFFQDVVADDEIRRQIGDQLWNAGDGDEFQRNQHHCRNEDADQHLFLFLCHGRGLPHSKVGRLCPETGDRRREVLEFNFTIRFDLFAGFEHGLHRLLLVCALGEFNDHLLRHEIDGRGGDALGLVRGFFHQVRAVRAVDFDLICLFHGVDLQLKFELNACLIFTSAVYCPQTGKSSL